MIGPDDRSALWKTANYFNWILKGIEPAHYPWPRFSDEWMIMKLRQIGFFSLLWILLSLVILFGGDE